tara:strand:+ start:4470 stop:5108 length:639 start_codon:yes stop_codon:yes gene_type:complete
MQNQSESIMILQAWFSPSFPVGAFSYSHGLETAINSGFIKSSNDLVGWINHLLKEGSGWNDGVFLSAAYNNVSDANCLCLSLAASRERHLETSEMGSAFVRAVNNVYGLELKKNLTYPVAIGKAAREFKIDLRLTLQSFLQSFVNNLIHVGIRIIPIGQEAGQDCLFRLMPNIKSLSEELANSSLYDLRGGAFFADLLSMHHEYSEQRIFRT